MDGAGPERVAELAAMPFTALLAYCSALCEERSARAQANMLAIRLEQGRPEIDVNTAVVLEPEVDCSYEVRVA